MEGDGESVSLVVVLFVFILYEVRSHDVDRNFKIKNLGKEVSLVR